MDDLEPMLTTSPFSTKPVAILDRYESFIWVDRYCGVGDFELTFSPTREFINFELSQSRGLALKESPKNMFVERYDMITAVGDPSKVKAKGRSLECFLERRVVWPMQSLEGRPQNIIHMVFEANMLSGAGYYREFPISFRATTDEYITNLPTFKIQYVGQSILNVVQEICTRFGIGYRVFVENESIHFELYRGKASGTVFSYDRGNLISSTSSNYIGGNKNAGYIVGEGEHPNKKFGYLNSLESGLSRFETYFDASDLVSNFAGVTLTQLEYQNMLMNRGYSLLAESRIPDETFVTEVDPSKVVYGVDYNLGDTVVIQDDYRSQTLYVKEVIISQDRDKKTIIPVFGPESDLQ